MIAHGEDGSHKRLARLCLLVDGVEGIAHLEMVAHTKAVHHLALRVVLLREDVIVAIGLEESLHVIILRLVGHEEHVLVAILLQHRGDTLAARSYRSLHQVAEHKGRETIERSRHTVVGMDAGTIKVGERQGMMIERIERWGERLLIAESAQQVCRHRLHQYHHHIRMILLHHQGIIHHLTLQNIRAIHLSRDTQPLAGIRDSLSVWHEMQLLVLLAHIVERRSKEIECRIDAELVEEGILAIVSLAHLDRIIAHSATDAEEAGANHHRRNEKTAAYQQQMHIVLRQQEEPLEIAAQADERIDKRPREYEIEGDIEPIGRLLQEHTRCGGYIAEPPEDAGVDVLEEILEIRGPNRRADMQFIAFQPFEDY